jgi:hypothetical protein
VLVRAACWCVLRAGACCVVFGQESQSPLMALDECATHGYPTPRAHTLVSRVHLSRACSRHLRVSLLSPHAHRTRTHAYRTRTCTRSLARSCAFPCAGTRARALCVVGCLGLWSRHPEASQSWRPGDAWRRGQEPLVRRRGSRAARALDRRAQRPGEVLPQRETLRGLPACFPSRPALATGVRVPWCTRQPVSTWWRTGRTLRGQHVVAHCATPRARHCRTRALAPPSARPGAEHVPLRARASSPTRSLTLFVIHSLLVESQPFTAPRDSRPPCSPRQECPQQPAAA